MNINEPPPWHSFLETGSAGFSQQKIENGEALLLRDDRGELLGVLYYCTQSAHGAWAGEVVCQTSPWFLRQRVMTRLMDEALHRWPMIDLEKQHCNAAGRAFIDKYLEQRAKR